MSGMYGGGGVDWAPKIAEALAAAIAADLGSGQSWQNMTAQRALSTVYTNTTGRQIAISLTVNGQGASPSVQVNGVQMAWASLPLGARFAFGVIVPAGHTYQLTNTGGALTIDTWAELR